jgi:hypothetical protein
MPFAANTNDTRCALDRGVRLVAHEYRRSIRRTSLLAAPRRAHPGLRQTADVKRPPAVAG